VPADPCRTLTSTHGFPRRFCVWFSFVSFRLVLYRSFSLVPAAQPEPARARVHIHTPTRLCSSLGSPDSPFALRPPLVGHPRLAPFSWRSCESSRHVSSAEMMGGGEPHTVQYEHKRPPHLPHACICHSSSAICGCGSEFQAVGR